MRPAGGGDRDDIGLAGGQRRIPIGAGIGNAAGLGHLFDHPRRAADDADNLGPGAAKGIGMALAGKAGAGDQNFQRGAHGVLLKLDD